jgi:hypothetical protein
MARRNLQSFPSSLKFLMIFSRVAAVRKQTFLYTCTLLAVNNITKNEIMNDQQQLSDM